VGNQKEPPKLGRLTRKKIMVLPAVIFLLGIVEYVLITYLTDSIAKARRLAASISVFIYIVLWFLVGREILLGKWWVAVVYAVGCAIGTFITCRSEKGTSILERLLGREFKH